MIAFLPIARYRVDYQIASGRPFSSFERLLLKAVQTGNGSVGSLAQMFAVHRRLIVEGLVTLMQAGWVSLGAGEAEFVLSPSGERACEGVVLPPTIALSDRQITIVVEKVTGQVARSNEVDFQTRANLKNLWDAGVPLRKGDISNIVDPALISPLLPHQPTEWIRWIGPISVLSDNAAFAVVDVDTQAESITGVPKNWTALLLPECLKEVSKRERERARDGVEMLEEADKELRQLVRRELPKANSDEISESDAKWSSLTIQPSDVLTSSDDHSEALDALLSDAQTYLGLACSDLNANTTAGLLPRLKAGVEKGLLINLFLAQIPRAEDPEARTAFEAFKKLEYDSIHGASLGRLIVGTRATECWSNVLLADTAQGVTAIVGSYSWASPSEPPRPSHTSIRICDPFVVARLCEVLAGFSAADEKLRLEAGFVRLRKAAGDLRQLIQTYPPSHDTAVGTEGTLLLDRDHPRAIYSLITSADRSIAVATENLSAFSRSGWLRFLIEPSRRFGSAVRLIYGAAKDADVADIPMLESLLKNGALLERREGLTTTMFAADDEQIILTSSRFDPTFARHSYSARIGIALKGTNVVSRLFGGI